MKRRTEKRATVLYARGLPFEMPMVTHVPARDGEPMQGVHVVGLWHGERRTIGASCPYCAAFSNAITDKHGKYDLATSRGDGFEIFLYAPGRVQTAPRSGTG